MTEKLFTGMLRINQPTITEAYEDVLLIKKKVLIIPPQTMFVGGYTVFTLSVLPCMRVSVTFCFLYNFKNH